MAYPFYQPYNSYYQQNYQPQQYQPTGVLWVSGEIEANSYPVAPNNAVALWDSSKPMVYLKQADASGKPTMKVYALSERTETAQIAPESQGDKLSEYAKKTDLSALEAAITALKKEIKTLKRKEVDEDDE